MAATYGAGVSAAIVVDCGAERTTVACVEDGIVVQETRMTLAVSMHSMARFLLDAMRLHGLPANFVSQTSRSSNKSVSTSFSASTSLNVSGVARAEWKMWMELVGEHHRILTLSEEDVLGPAIFECYLRLPPPPPEKTQRQRRCFVQGAVF